MCNLFGPNYFRVLVVIFALCLAGLTNLESLNLDSCTISDEGLANLTGFLSIFYCFYFITFWITGCDLIQVFLFLYAIEILDLRCIAFLGTRERGIWGLFIVFKI